MLVLKCGKTKHSSFPMNPPSIQYQAPACVKITLPAKRRYFPNLFGWLFALFGFLTLIVLALPGGSHVQVRGLQTRSLAQAKQIGLALRLFADDHNGKFPGQGVPVEMTRAPMTSNAAFAPLFPTYFTSERIFGNKLSAYQTRQPDDVIDSSYTGTPVKTLEAGENVYAYVAGLTEKSDPDAPLVLDGTDGSLYYNSNPTLRGGVWGGKKAVVVYLDDHAAVETLAGRENTRYIAAHLPGRPANLLDLSWLGSDVHLLNPAVAP